MKQASGNPFWRADLAARDALRTASAQASEVAQTSARVANWWGGPGVILFGATLWLGARAIRRSAAARAGLRGIEALAVASAISGIVKGLAGRARPFLGAEPWHWEFNHGWTDARFFSMPSGHTTATTAFAVGVLLATAGWPVARRLAVGSPLVLTVLYVAWARMFADQHWLSDIVTAMILGAATAIVLARVHAGRKPSAYDRVMLGADALAVAPGAGSSDGSR